MFLLLIHVNSKNILVTLIRNLQERSHIQNIYKQHACVWNIAGVESCSIIIDYECQDRLVMTGVIMFTFISVPRRLV